MVRILDFGDVGAFFLAASVIAANIGIGALRVLFFPSSWCPRLPLLTVPCFATVATLDVLTTFATQPIVTSLETTAVLWRNM